tara:strand:+ start:51 stop:1022 length:972 start_codon:yes stop_codon:yes gene_type:complete
MNLYETLTDKNLSRLNILPIQYDDIWSFYKKQMSLFWTAEEIPYSNDLNDWKNLSDNERFFIKQILSFFATADGIVVDNLVDNFINEFEIIEVKYNYTWQAMMENIHTETYNLLLDTLISDSNEKNKLLNGITNNKYIKKKSDWIKIYFNQDIPIGKRLIAFAIVEGLFFSGSFCSLYWLKDRGLCPALTFSNELIARDEGMHTEFAVLLYNKYIINKQDEIDIHNMIKKAVDIEIDFITNAIKENLIGINSVSMSNYIKYVADRLLLQLNYSKIYNTSNPFDFMNKINIDLKENFFERKVLNYRKYGINELKNDKFSLDDDF